MHQFKCLVFLKRTRGYQLENQEEENLLISFPLGSKSSKDILLPLFFPSTWLSKTIDCPLINHWDPSITLHGQQQSCRETTDLQIRHRRTGGGEGKGKLHLKMVQLATWLLTTVSIEDPPILLLLVVDKENVPIQGNFMHRGHWEWKNHSSPLLFYWREWRRRNFNRKWFSQLIIYTCTATLHD